MTYKIKPNVEKQHVKWDEKGGDFRVLNHQLIQCQYSKFQLSRMLYNRSNAAADVLIIWKDSRQFLS